MKKIILFNPMPRGFEGEEKNFHIPPLSLLAVASGIVDLPYEIIIIDEVIEPDYQNKIKNLLNETICVGITSMTGYQIKRGLIFSEFIRKHNKNIPIVWGGYHASSLPEQTVKDKRIDIVIIGQGQNTFRDLILAFEEKKDLKQVKGIIFKKNNEIFKTPDREIIDINEFPSLPYNLINMEKYISDPAGTGDRVIGYITSQGCPYNCTFCAELKVTKRKWFGLDPIRIVNEWQIFKKKYQITQITVYDSDFCVDTNRLKILIKEMLSRNLNISIGFINVRTDQIKRFDDELLELLSKINCTTFLIGAESGSDEILNYINKNCSVEDTLIAKKKLSKYNFIPMFSFMFGLAFDKSLKITTKQEFNMLLDLIDKIRKIDDRNIINIWNYTPYPGAPLTEKAIEAGFEMPDTLEKWADFHYSTVHVPWVEETYSKKLEFLRNMIFPYISHQFSQDWDKIYKGKNKKIKKLFHNSLRTIALFRLKHRFFTL
ncbi:B12-binding domain-containing radical SAM protein, partial [bacterium]|nr:B12-binding domain-containing radical SAM protein [bacterium]